MAGWQRWERIEPNLYHAQFGRSCLAGVDVPKILRALFSELTLVPNLFETGGQGGQLLVREFLDVDHFVVCAVQRPDELVELEVHGSSIAVLSVLDQEYHQERNNRGGRTSPTSDCYAAANNSLRSSRWTADDERLRRTLQAEIAQALQGVDGIFKPVAFALRRVPQFLHALNDCFERFCNTQRLKDRIPFEERSPVLGMPLMSHVAYSPHRNNLLDS